MLGFVVGLIFLVPATAACLAYLIPTLVGRRRTAAPPHLAHLHTFTVLIPAHNEETSLPATLRSLRQQEYPADRVRVVVVADNCTDATAAIVPEGQCLVRNDPSRPGKGRAVAFGLERVLPERPEIVLVLDADCELNPEALRSLNDAFNMGAVAAQAEVRSRNAADGAAGYVAAVGAALDAAAAAGWHRLGASVPLRGTGMAFRREVLERIPWTAFGPVEDAEYQLRLRAAGVRVRYCPDAVVSCQAPGDAAALYTQRRRWRSATRLLSSKPLILLHLAITLGACAAVGIWLWPLVLLVLTAGLYLRAMVEIGLSRARIPVLFDSVRLVVRLAVLTLGGVVRRTPTRWESV